LSSGSVELIKAKYAEIVAAIGVRDDDGFENG